MVRMLLALMIQLCLSIHTIPAFAMAGIVKAEDFKHSGFVGFNLGNKHGAGLNFKDLEDIGKAGANLTRVMVRLNRCPSCGYYVMSPDDIGFLDSVIAGGEKNNFKVVIVFQILPERELAEFWNNNELRSSVKRNWEFIARRFRNNIIVAGYDLINEPSPSGQNMYFQTGIWVDFASELISAIRVIDPEHVIIFESPGMGGPHAFNSLKPFPFPQIVYSFHFYVPHQITHQGLYNFKAIITYPSDPESPIGTFDKQKLSIALDSIRAFSKHFNVPVYVGEFSCIRSAPNGSAYRYVHDALELFEAEGWSWNYHAFREWDGWDAEISSENLNNRQRTLSSPVFELLKQHMRPTK